MKQFGFIFSKFFLLAELRQIEIETFSSVYEELTDFNNDYRFNKLESGAGGGRWRGWKWREGLSGVGDCCVATLRCHSLGGYRNSSPTAVQAWRTCPLWEPSPSHPILVQTRGLLVCYMCSILFSSTIVYAYVYFVVYVVRFFFCKNRRSYITYIVLVQTLNHAQSMPKSSLYLGLLAVSTYYQPYDDGRAYCCSPRCNAHHTAVNKGVGLTTKLATQYAIHVHVQEISHNVLLISLNRLDSDLLVIKQEAKLSLGQPTVLPKIIGVT